MLRIALLFVMAINLATFVSFGIDKRRARAGRRRISEADLLALALLGGSPAALLARSIFRHKTRKQPFSSRLWNIVVVQVVAIGAAIGYVLAG